MHIECGTGDCPNLEERNCRKHTCKIAVIKGDTTSYTLFRLQTIEVAGCL